MGNIPLPALAIQPTPDPLNEYLRAASLQQQLSASRQQQAQQAQAFPVAQQQAQATLQETQQQNQIRAQQIQDQQSLRDISPKHVTRDDSGKPGYDWEGFFNEATEKGVSPQTIDQLRQTHQKTMETYLSLDKSQREKETENNKWLFESIESLKGIEDPNQKQQQYQTLAGHAQRRGIDVSQFPAQAPSNDELTALEAPLGMHAQVLADAKTQAETKKAAMGDISMQELNAYLANPRLDPGIKKDAATFAAWKAKQTPAAVILGNQLGKGGAGSALDQAAERYSQTGELPAGFSRSPGTMTAIMNRAAELHPDQNLVANKSINAANKTALSQLQSQFSKVSSFENTAIKNLDLYVQKAKAIPDLGVRFADVPLRMITGKMIGEKNYAAMKAAQATASAEVGKVLSSATGSGVLSDSQRKEAQDVLDGNLPLAATLEVVETLKQDLANRHQSYQDEIDNLTKQVGHAGAPPNSGNSGGHVIRIGQKRYQYKGSGDTADLANYTELK